MGALLDGMRADINTIFNVVSSTIQVSLPTYEKDAAGQVTGITWSDAVTESVWCRRLRLRDDVVQAGLLSTEDLRILAPYTTTIVVDAKVTYRGEEYRVTEIEASPDIEGGDTHKVFFARKKVN